MPFGILAEREARVMIPVSIGSVPQETGSFKRAGLFRSPSQITNKLPAGWKSTAGELPTSRFPVFDHAVEVLASNTTAPTRQPYNGQRSGPNESVDAVERHVEFGCDVAEVD
jgi:hypothetical protein